MEKRNENANIEWTGKEVLSLEQVKQRIKYTREISSIWIEKPGTSVEVFLNGEIDGDNELKATMFGVDHLVWFMELAYSNLWNEHQKLLNEKG